MASRLNLYFILLLALPVQHSYAQQYSEDSLINSFRNDVRIEQREYGRVMWDDETKESFYLLVITLCVDDLKKYVSDSNPVVRSSVYAALAHKNADDKILREILAAHQYDTATFKSGGDAVITWTVRDHMKTGLDLKTEGKLTPFDYQAALERIRMRPKFIIPGCHHNIVNKDSLLSISQLKYSVDGSKVVSLKLTVGEKTVSANDLSGHEIKEMIRSLHPGERIFIDDIRATVQGKSVKLPSLVLKISDQRGH